MTNQNPSEQSGGRPKNTEDRTEKRRRSLRRMARRVAGKAVRLAEDVAMEGAATSIHVARRVVQRIGLVDDEPRRKRINVAD
jgi:hypothetical protein